MKVRLRKGYNKEDDKMIKNFKINWRVFKELWNRNADQYDFYKHLRLDRFITKEEWDRAWQYRLILHPNYQAARSDLLDALICVY